METWKGSVFPVDGRLKIAVKVDGKWRQVKTPYRIGQETKAAALLKRTRELLLAGDEAGLGPAPTLRAYRAKWIEQRKMHGVASWADDDSRLRTHILPALGLMQLAEVRPRHVAEMVAKVRAGGAAPRTVRNVYAVVRAMFRDAQIAGLVEHQPCILTHHQLGKIRDAKHEWRAGAVFSADELRELLTDARVPQDRRVLYGLASLGVLRHGEAAGLRWRHLIAGLKPLGRLVVATSYNKGTTKTNAERWMPVHPMLAKMLAEWKLSGWALAFYRRPGPNDLVVPHTKPTNKGPRVTFGGMRSDHDSYKRLRIDLAALGHRQRRFHDLRRTGITLYREAGADKDVLRLCTHGAPGQDVMELYTTFGWETPCRQVALCGFCADTKRRRVKK